MKEAIHVISVGYEEKTEWGKEVIQSIQLYNKNIHVMIVDQSVIH
jgi:hypothetical protein